MENTTLQTPDLEEVMTSGEIDLESLNYKPKILIVGVGGGGGNALSNIVSSTSFAPYKKNENITTIAFNTDAAALKRCQADKKMLLMGAKSARGFGAGGDPEVASAAAEASAERAKAVFKDADMVFITAGLGGGTGSGAAPKVAEWAREAGALTVAVVTMPFSFEGVKRRNFANESLASLRDKVDTLLLIENDHVLKQAEANKDALDMRSGFVMIDDVLRKAVVGVLNIITTESYINIDFADVRAILQNSKTAVMGIGFASGDNALEKAFNAATTDSLISAPRNQTARNALYFVESNLPLSLAQVNSVSSKLKDFCTQDAQIVWGQGQKDFDDHGDVTSNNGSDYDFSRGAEKLHDQKTPNGTSEDRYLVQVTLFLSGFTEKTQTGYERRANPTMNAEAAPQPRVDAQPRGFSLEQSDLLNNNFGVDTAFDEPAFLRRKN